MQSVVCSARVESALDYLHGFGIENGIVCSCEGNRETP